MKPNKIPYICILMLLLLVSCTDRVTFESKFNPADFVVAKPRFSPSGGSFNAPRTVTISCSTPEATIRYTTNGSEPTSSSKVYTEPVLINANTTLKAKGFREKWFVSETEEKEYSFQVIAPTFNPPGGYYNTGQNVSINCATSDATIRYTTNGSEPTASSPVYTSPLQITAGLTTVKAKVFKTGWNESITAEAVYGVMVVAPPVFSPPGGNYTANQSVTITCATSEATIRYTTNGTEPTESAAQYTSPIQITGNTTLKAKAFRTGWTISQTVTAQYDYAVAAPTFNPPGGNYTANQSVTITCATSQATIKYTTNGAEPTESATQYTSPIQITGNTTLKAKAFRTGWTTSQTTTGEYSFTVATPTFNPPGGNYNTLQTVTITCATVGAVIRYTTNGSEPTTSSAIYNSPVNVSSNTTLKAKAYRAGWTDSATSSAIYTFPMTAMVSVGGGTFNPVANYTVTLSSFYMGKYEVTQSEYQSVMGTNPSSFSGNPNRPVEMVSWFDAIEYCNRLSIREGLTPAYSYSTHGTNPANWPAGWNTSNANHTNVSCNWNADGYRLPTEMEWEFAARGGVPAQNGGTFNTTYAGSNSIGGVAWYTDNSGSRTHDVGTKAPNELGLYDMSGNVWEWSWDIYGSYPTGSHNNPKGASSGTSRVRRGGSWSGNALRCTVSYRYDYLGASSRNYNVGFRCVRRVD